MIFKDEDDKFRILNLRTGCIPNFSYDTLSDLFEDNDVEIVSSEINIFR